MSQPAAQPLPAAASHPVVPSRSRLRGALVAALTVVATAASTLVAGSAAAAPMIPRKLPAAIERLAPYQPQATCSPTAKPGTVALRALVLRTYPGTRDSGISRACSIGGRSEHKEGRAWDWGARYTVASERRKAQDFINWLLAKDNNGNPYAMARRLGVQYVIYNKRIWASYNPSWRAYTGADPHTSHVHISLTWPGARQQTSFWTKSTPYRWPATPTRPSPTPAPAPVTVRYPEPTPQPAPSPAPTGAPIEDETLVLNSQASAGVSSKGLLQAGERYRVTISGAVSYGGGMADAECSTAGSSSAWARGRSIVGGHSGWDTLDTYLNGYDLGGRPTTDTGDSCNAADHTYVSVFTAPATDRAKLQLWDPLVFGDNKGSLTARIEHLGLPVGGGSDGDTDPDTGADDVDVSSPVTFTVDASKPEGSGPGLRVQAGHQYRVVMTGTYEYGGGLADAECSTTGSDSTWRRARDWGVGDGDGDLLDLKLGNRTDPGGESATGGDCDVTGHSYSYVWTPSRDQALRAFVYDTVYSDNKGTLTVTVTPL